MAGLLVKPIGYYHSTAKHTYDVGRQPAPDDERLGEIRLLPGFNFQQALIGLETFSRIWILFDFHRNRHWHPMVTPPRGTRKQGVFATRSPHRPNPIGMSNARLLGVRGLRLDVQGLDLLDGTPILDIKPYLAEVDAFQGETAGWVAENGVPYAIEWSQEALLRLDYLATHGVTNLRHFCEQQMAFEPFNSAKKRVTWDGSKGVLAYRTWRLEFAAPSTKVIQIQKISSGYSEADLARREDPWSDKELHRTFQLFFDAN